MAPTSVFYDLLFRVSAPSVKKQRRAFLASAMLGKLAVALDIPSIPSNWVAVQYRQLGWRP
jgi:hypothetical protein